MDEKIGITDIRIASISKGSQLHIPSVFQDIGVGKGCQVMIIGYEDRVEIRPAENSLKMIQDILSGKATIPVNEEPETVEEPELAVEENNGIAEEKLAELDEEESDVVGETLDENFDLDEVPELQVDPSEKSNEDGDLTSY